MPDRLKHILDCQETIVAVYRENHLTCLTGLDEKYQINGRQFLSWYSTVTRKCWVKYPQTDPHTMLDDLLFCSDELLYFTAHLFLYRPFINDPLSDGWEFNGEMIYPNNMNMAGKRYHMFSDVVSQKAYNFWDRIGDLLASFFPNRIKPHLVGFTTAIENIPLEYQTSINFQWLKNFHDNQYRELNHKRKQVVHYTTTSTKYSRRHLESVSNRLSIESLQNEHTSLPEYYRTHINLTIQGFEKTLLFLEELEKDLFVDVLPFKRPFTLRLYPVVIRIKYKNEFNLMTENL